MFRRFVWALLPLLVCATLCATPAKADYIAYPCSGAGNGFGVDVNLLLDVSGQFCDSVTQINLSHLHCLSGGARLNLGALAFAPIGGVSLGGLGGGGSGASGASCVWLCPDGAPAPQPNPPYLSSNIPYIDVNRIIKAHRAFCVVGNHLMAAGPTSELVRPEEGDPDLYQPGPDLIPHPAPPAPPPDGEAPEPAPEPAPAHPGD